MSQLQKKIEFELIWKRINGKLTGREEKLFFQWLNADSKNAIYFEKAKVFYNSGNIYNAKQIDIDSSWKRTEPRLKRTGVRKLPNWIKISVSVAATVVIMLSVYIIVETKQGSPTDNKVVETTVQIPAGTSRARLILDNGKSIDLSKEQIFETELHGAIVSNQGSQISYSASPSVSASEELYYNTLEIPRGAEYFIILSDSTKVWLNSDSRLTYPVKFGRGERKVELIGEAYFEVSRDQSKPFVVKTGGQVIEVLGTAFNVSSYAESDLVYTTLVEGKVKVYAEDNTGLSQNLLPGYQTYYYKTSGDISIREVNIKEYVAWKEGMFSFRNKTLETMMETLSRWYNINVIFENKNRKDIKFTGDIQRYEELDKLLFLLERTHEVKFEINDNVLVIK